MDLEMQRKVALDSAVQGCVRMRQNNLSFDERLETGIVRELLRLSDWYRGFTALSAKQHGDWCFLQAQNIRKILRDLRTENLGGS